MSEIKKQFKKDFANICDDWSIDNTLCVLFREDNKKMTVKKMYVKITE